MIQSILGKKLGQVQGFLENGNRVPMTKILVDGNVISQIKTLDKEGYEAVQLGFGNSKHVTKPLIGHAKKAGLKVTPRIFRESKVDKIDGIESGAEVNVSEVLEAGDIVDVTGISKGKGYAGVVKRHHFKGGPKTHGQSDRHRAPGSIGQSTTPGRVYKGKRMSGRMGNEQVTIKNLEVIELNDGILLLKGLIPGPISSVVTITRKGTNKKHIGLYKEVVEEVAVDEAKVEEIGESVEEQEDLRKEVEAKVEAEGKEEQAAAQVANQEKPEDVKTEEVKEEEVVTPEESKDGEEEKEKKSV
jgi:large subunit ribosomal protein L3